MRRVAITVEQNWNRVPGGTAKSTNRLIDALLATEQVDLTGVAGTHRRPATLELPTGLDTTIVPIPGRVLAQSWNLLGLPSIDRWLPGREVVHGPAYMLPPSSAAPVATVHDLAFLHHPDWFSRHGVRFLTRFLEQVRDRRAHVIVPSDATAGDCVGFGIPSELVHTIPWGIDPPTITAEQADAVRRRHGMAEGAVLYVGTLEPRKNLDGLAAAMARLPGRQLVAVGPAGWGDVRIDGAVLTGELADHEVAGLMASAAVLVYPSHFEGFGLPVLEAMAQGTPVVVTAGTVPETIAGDAGLAVDTSDPAALAEALESLLDDDGRRDRLGAMGRERARQFRWSTTAERTIAVYGEAAA